MPTLAISTLTLPNWDQQLAYNQTINTSGGVNPLTFSSTGALPTGLTLSAGGVLAGTPTATGSYAFTITATDGTSATASQSYTIAISPPVTISTTSLPDWTVDKPNYGRLIATSGGQGNFNFFVTGTLPPGLTVGGAGANGTGITGTPTSIGVFTFTVTATDVINGNASQAFTININPSLTFPVKTIASFNNANVANPTSVVVESGTGNLFGATPNAVFEVNAASSNITTVASLDIATTGTNPSGPLLEDSGGNLFGTAAVGGSSLNGTVFEVRKGTNTASLLATFDGADGSHPNGGLVEDKSGDLYGTTEYGGLSFTGQNTGYGVVFELAHGGGAIVVLATFNGTNGANPAGGLVLDSNGNIFGTTSLGGTSNRGTIFEIQKGAGTIITLRSFNTSDPYWPTGALVEDNNGNLFGTTQYGYEFGQVFELPHGSNTLRYLGNFTGNNGGFPTGGVVLDSNGNIFGTTDFGGPGYSANTTGYGTVFEVQQGSGSPSTVAVFTATDGAYPAGGVVMDSVGNLFGTTQFGGIGYSGGRTGFGTVFEIVSALPNGAVNKPGYSQTLLATGGTGSIVFAVSGGTLPPGLILGNSGVLSGTPTTSGTFHFTVTASDAVGANTSHNYALIIDPAVMITTTALADSMVGTAYNETITALSALTSNGMITFSTTAGTVPAGLTLSSVGVLSGSSTTVGIYNFTLTATDALGNTASQAYMMTVFSGALSPSTLPDWTVNQAGYNQTLAATGGLGPFNFSLKSGTLPPGLTLAAAGTLTGVPTAIGAYGFTVLATDSMGDICEQSYIVAISPNPTITTTTLPAWTANLTGYSQQISVADGTGNTSFSISTGNLPAGLTLSTGGRIAGTPTITGSFMFTVTATDITGASTSQNYAMTVNPVVSLPSTLPSGTAGTSYSQTLATMTGTGRVTFTWTGVLPPGLTMLPSGGLFGTPTTSGTYSFTATGKDSLGATGSQTYMLTIAPGQFTQFLVTIAGPTTIQAGDGILVVIEAADKYGNAVTSYSGRPTVTPSINPASVGSSVPASVNLDSSGLGYFLATVQKPGSYTISVTDGSYSGSSGSITVMPGPTARLAFAGQPASTPTGDILPTVTVQVEDVYGNVIATDNTDTVTLGVASGPAGVPGFTSGSTLAATVTNGVATFNNLTLVTPGTYQLSAIVPGLYTGPYSAAFSVVPLQVVPGSFVGTPSGFSLQFNAPILVNATTPVLYGAGNGASGPPPSVIVTTDPGNLGDTAAYVAGSLVLNAATNTLTFLPTNTTLEGNNGSPLLPDGNYTVIVRSSASTDGLQALNAAGGFLDGLGSGMAGSGDFRATYTVNAAAMHDDVLWVPDTADGPGQALNGPGQNQAGGGYPVYLNDSTGAVTQVQLTLDYDPTLLTVSGVTGAGFSLVATSTPGQAMLQYSGPALPTGSQIPIGFLTATVPSGTSAKPLPYRAEDLLHLANVSLNGGSIPVATSDGLHLVAYVGDANGDGVYTGDDAVRITRVVLQTDSGFAAYPRVDPVIVADTDGSSFIPADAALQVNEAGVGVPTVNLPVPPIPSGVHFLARTASTHPSARIISDVFSKEVQTAKSTKNTKETTRDLRPLLDAALADTWLDATETLRGNGPAPGRRSFRHG